MLRRTLPGARRLFSCALLGSFSLVLGAGTARADTALTQLSTWSGSVDFFATGAPMAAGPAGATEVDHLLHPASVDVLPDSIPPEATLQQAYLYWAGTVTQPSQGACSDAAFDRTVDFTAPGASAPVSITADACYCSDGANSNYDMTACRADVTDIIRQAGGSMVGTYAVDGFNALVTNPASSATRNASFSIVLVYKSPALKQRTIALYDGLSTFFTNSATFSLTGLHVDDPPQGDITWYTAEGDASASPGDPMPEQVKVKGLPGGKSLIPVDPVNPPNDPMNHTINTVSPPRTDTIGVDIDRFDISSALTPGDDHLDMTYTASMDKWWLIYNVVGVNVFVPQLGVASRKKVLLLTDADGNGVPSSGDTIRYTIHLENTGNAPVNVQVADPIPAAASSWQLVSAAGGMDASTPTTLTVNAVPVAPGGIAEVVFDMIIGDVQDETPLQNTAAYDGRPTAEAGMLTAPDLVIRRDTDGDGIFDHQDDCPMAFDPNQTDSDGDGLGDACDPCPHDNMNDPDKDGICQDVDNCPSAANADQRDSDKDGIGDACDLCPYDATNDADMDGVCQDVDNCPAVANPNQEDTDKDGIGDACDVCPKDPSNLVDDKGVCNADKRRFIKNGCGCSGGPDVGALAFMAVLAAQGLRRRSRRRAA